jgi:uncharacterized protein with WD repeat
VRLGLEDEAAYGLDCQGAAFCPLKLVLGMVAHEVYPYFVPRILGGQAVMHDPGLDPPGIKPDFAVVDFRMVIEFRCHGAGALWLFEIVDNKSSMAVLTPEKTHMQATATIARVINARIDKCKAVVWANSLELLLGGFWNKAGDN